MPVLLLVFVPALAVALGLPQDHGALSMYAPGDGWNHGELACGGQFTNEQEHIAYRKWWKVGCGRELLVCAWATQRCALTRVRDAGPYGIITGSNRHARRDGRWKVFTGPGRPPRGWRYRAIADLSVGLWRRLGRPGGLTRISLFFLPSSGARSSHLASLIDYALRAVSAPRRAPTVL